MDAVVYFVLFAIVGRLMHHKGDVVTWDGVLPAAAIAGALYVLVVLAIRSAPGIWAVV